MKKLCLLAALSLGSLAAQAADVGVSVQIGQPGFYGRIDIGNMPSPGVIYTQPMLIKRVAHPPPPLYLRVPPGHYKNWGKHCHRYDACGRPVYFVREDWYERQYHGRPQERRDDREDRREDRRDDRRDDGPGRGHGHGKHGH